jgi:hypothetical protein
MFLSQIYSYAGRVSAEAILRQLKVTGLGIPEMMRESLLSEGKEAPRKI